MSMSIGRKIAKQILEGKAYGYGEYWPPYSEFEVTITNFTFFESDQDSTETWKIEAKCDKVVSGGEEYGEGEKKVRAVKPGESRVQIISMKHQPAPGNVAQFLSAAFAAYLEMEGNIPWQDEAVLKGLLRHFKIKTKGKDYEQLTSDLLERLVDPEEQPFNGIKLRLRTTIKVTKKNRVPVTVHWWETLDLEDEEEDEEIPF